MMIATKHLTMDTLMNTVRTHFDGIGDPRERSGKYPLSDVMMSGLAMFHFKLPALQSFDEEYRKNVARSENLKRLFGVREIPSDTQMGDVTDRVPSEEIAPVFDTLFEELRRGNHLRRYRYIDGAYLLDLDASEYFRSEKIQCPNCLRFEITEKKPARKSAKKSAVALADPSEDAEGADKVKVTQYAHRILQAAIVHPDLKEVIPFASEEIRNTDGKEKQDCELNAARRFLIDLKRRHPRLKLIVNADGLYANTPFIRLLEELGISFIIVIADGDHRAFVENWEGLARGGLLRTLKIPEPKGGFRQYTWMEGLELSDRKDAARVNVVQLEIFDAEGKLTYFNRWGTNLRLTIESVVLIARAGRSRWKIENEVFNTLKKGGYHIEHNFGHGKNRLSFNFFLLNLLAFFLHQILMIVDSHYQSAVASMRTRKRFWERLQSLFDIFVFDDWTALYQAIPYRRTILEASEVLSFR